MNPERIYGVGSNYFQQAAPGSTCEFQRQRQTQVIYKDLMA